MTGRKTQNPMDIFFSHVTPGRMDDCWLWEGCLYRGGYGIAWYKNYKTGAHRVAYMLFVGEIPAGLEVMHSCHNRRCVNPAHLSVGTHAENMAQTSGRRNPSMPRGEKHHNARLTAEKVKEIRRLKKTGLSDREIGQRFGVSGQTIWLTIKRKMWNHVADE